MTFEEMKCLSEEEQKELFLAINKKRSQAKTVNFASTYGSGVNTLAKNLGGNLELAKKLYDTYWKRNWSLKEVVNNFIFKIYDDSGNSETYNGKYLMNLSMKKQQEIENKAKSIWVFNPVSKLWISLRYFKDAFSSINQSTAVYVFDNYLKELRGNFNIILQYHDRLCRV